MAASTPTMKKNLKRTSSSSQIEEDGQNKQLKKETTEIKPKTIDDFPSLKEFMETHKLVTLDRALFKAVELQNVEILKILISLKVSMVTTNHEGNMPLHALLSHLLDANAIDEDDDVTFKPFQEIVGLLLNSNQFNTLAAAETDKGVASASSPSSSFNFSGCTVTPISVTAASTAMMAKAVSMTTATAAAQVYMHYNLKRLTIADLVVLLEQRTQNQDIREALDLITQEIRAKIVPYLVTLKNREFRDYSNIITYQFSQCHSPAEIYYYRSKEMAASIKAKLEDPIIEQITESYRIGFGLAQFNKETPFLLPGLRSLVMEYCGNVSFANDAYNISQHIPFWSYARTDLYRLIHSIQIIPKPINAVIETINKTGANEFNHYFCSFINRKDGVSTYKYCCYQELGDSGAVGPLWVGSIFSVLESCREGHTVVVNQTPNYDLNATNFLCLHQYRIHLASKNLNARAEPMADIIDEPAQNSYDRYRRL